MALTGFLLVASPAMSDPNFVRTVVLVVDHDEDGAVGVILNRPTDIPVTDDLPDLADLVDEPACVFAGGPVQPSVAIALGYSDARPVGWVPLGGGLGMVDLDAAVGPLDRLRVFAGYAGWASGQLEAEIDAGDWIVAATDPADPFTGEPATLWRQVLARQPGPERMLASYPDDPHLN